MYSHIFGKKLQGAEFIGPSEVVVDHYFWYFNFLLLSLFFHPVPKIPEGVVIGFQNFAWILISQNIRIPTQKQIWRTAPPGGDSFKI